MKFFITDKIRQADAYTIANEPISSIDLMERAALELQKWIIDRFQPSDTFKIFAGPGNNGGDAWALGRLLRDVGFQNISVFQVEIGSELSADAQINCKRYIDSAGETVFAIRSEHDFPEITNTDIIIDGLFGSGLSRPAEGLAAMLIRHINDSYPRNVIAIDIPSGLFGEDNGKNIPGNILRADFTLTFQFPKLSFFFAENEKFVGNWDVLPIKLHPGFILKEETPFHYITEIDIRNMLIKRSRFSHKGTYGHGLLIAGSYGMMGAAVLAARAAVRGGAGLLTAHIPRMGVEIVQTSVPESLISIDESDIIFTGSPDPNNFTAIAIGPGLNRKSNSGKGLIQLLKKAEVPVLIDADGLNLLSDMKDWTELLPKETILTPHPKEYERLFGKNPDSYHRLEQQRSFSVQYKCVIILKGAHTCITTPDGNAWFNTTGNPGMAKGGSGDVLTGLILGLLTQGYSPTAASLMGVYIHGMAGDKAAEKNGENGMIPSDIIDNIGKVFNVLEKITET